MEQKAMTARKSEEQLIQNGLKRWGRNAYLRTLSNGDSATVLRGNKICKVSNRQVNVLMEVEQSRYKITQRTFKLK